MKNENSSERSDSLDNGEGSYRRFLDGDNNGLAEIIKEYKDGLIFYLVGFVKDIDTAEELAQETFVRLFVKKPRFSGKSQFKTWLYSVGRHIAYDYLRKNKKRLQSVQPEERDIPDEALSPETVYFNNERSLALYRGMQKLKGDYYRVLWLTYFENMSNKETAELMKKSLGSTQVLLTRARAALKAELEKEGFNDENL